MQWKKEFDEEDDYPDYKYLTYNEFFHDYDKMEYETFTSEFTSESGDIVHSFGYFGHD